MTCDDDVVKAAKTAMCATDAEEPRPLFSIVRGREEIPISKQMSKPVLCISERRAVGIRLKRKPVGHRVGANAVRAVVGPDGYVSGRPELDDDNEI